MTFADPGEMVDPKEQRRDALGALTVLLLGLAVMLAVGCSFVIWGQQQIRSDLSDQATRGYEARAITCIVVTHDKANAGKPVPPQCLDPNVLRYVPPEYRYTK